jgi:hypothetical protein
MTRRRFSTIVVVALAGLTVAGPVSGTAAASGAITTTAGSTSSVLDITRDVRISDGPSVVVTPAGTTIAVWIQRNQHIMASTRSVGSEQWSEPTTVARNGFYAAVATYGSDRAVIAWQGLDQHSSAFIRARTVRAGVHWGQPDLVNRWVRSGGVTVALTVAANRDGTTLVAWTRGGKVRATYGVVGGVWSEPHAFSDDDAYSYEASANVRPDGEADLIFPAERSGRLSKLRVYHLTQSGHWQGDTAAKYATGLHARGPTFDAAVNARGDIIVAWMRRANPGEAWRIYQSYRSAGGQFSTPRELWMGGRAPVAAIDGGGAASIAFLRERDASTETMFAFRPLSGYWTRPTAVSAVEGSPAYPSLDLKTNLAGDFFVQSVGQHPVAGQLVDDHRLVHCGNGVCGPDEVVDGPRGDQPMTAAVRPKGAVDVLWTFGCATEECIPTGIRAARFIAR